MEKRDMTEFSRKVRLGGSTIRARLVRTFAGFILLLAAMAGVGAWRLADLSTVTQEMATVNLRMERLVGEWLAQTRSNVVRATVLTQSDDPELRRLLAPAMEKTTRKINELQREVEQLLDSDEAKRLFGEVSVRRAAYLDARTIILESK
jgi:methyl-accepting chemotaxis protein